MTVDSYWLDVWAARELERIVEDSNAELETKLSPADAVEKIEEVWAARELERADSIADV